MNLRQMEVFRAVMLTGGVNSAAVLLHVSPPAVSKVLAQAARAAGLPRIPLLMGIPAARDLAAWPPVLRDELRELVRARVWYWRPAESLPGFPAKVWWPSA